MTFVVSAKKILEYLEDKYCTKNDNCQYIIVLKRKFWHAKNKVISNVIRYTSFCQQFGF